MTQNHIKVLSIEELTTETKDASRFFGYPVLLCINNVNQSFERVYTLFDKSAELLQSCNARNEYEEAALHNLRHAMENLFYQMREDFFESGAFSYGSLCDGAKCLVSIFIHLPNIMTEKEKDTIFSYLCEKNLLHN